MADIVGLSPMEEIKMIHRMVEIQEQGLWGIHPWDAIVVRWALQIVIDQLNEGRLQIVREL